VLTPTTFCTFMREFSPLGPHEGRAKEETENGKICGQVCVVRPDSLSMCVSRCTVMSLYVLCRTAMRATCGVLTDYRGYPGKSIPPAFYEGKRN